jgi:peptidoglycan/LPS O-acetylase OafA/YrhL
MSPVSLALRNLRGLAILLIVAFHCFSAYIVNQPAQAPPFDLPPYDWRAMPIIDSERWLGFDLFCAFQFLYLMQLMFFLSGLFVWPSLLRRGWSSFVGHRLVRLGVPFIVGVYLVMPVAFYPVYRLTATDPGWSAFWLHWSALPITPTGPMWFLWFLIALNVGAAALYRVMPGMADFLARPLDNAAARPSRLFLVAVCVTAVTYLPLAAIYSPWKWVGVGPFEVQAAFAAQYALYFVLGLAIGAHGYERGLLDRQGMLMRRWRLWVGGAFLAFFLWVIPTALIVKVPGAPTAVLQVIGDLGLVIFAGAACFSITAVFLRFAAKRWPPVIDTVSENAYGIYFFHYLFALWLQYLLLDLAIPAIGKGLIVFAATVALSWLASTVVDRTLASGRVLLGRGTTWSGAPSIASGPFSGTKFSD